MPQRIARIARNTIARATHDAREALDNSNGDRYGPVPEADALMPADDGQGLSGIATSIARGRNTVARRYPAHGCA